MAAKSTKILCRACDMVVELPPFRKHITCLCPICKTALRSGFRTDLYNVAVVSIASVILMLTSLTLPFMTISSMGITQSMSLTSIFFILRDDWSVLLYLFLLFTFFCPLIMHTIVIGIVFFKLRISRQIAQLYSMCHRFSMVDVFVLGVLISLIKLVALAKVEFHSGFYSTLLFALLMVWCFSRGSPYFIWNLVEDQPKNSPLKTAKLGIRGIDQNLISCRHCGLVYKAKDGFEKANSLQTCPRCGHHNGIRAFHCYQKTIALLIAAVIVYIPSNVYPIMITSYLGTDTGSNIIDGVISLWAMKSYFVAAVILIASICIPLIKIICIVLLMYWSKWGFKGDTNKLNKLYRVVIFIGRWSMIDVFVVIIMSTLVRMSGLLTISPGIAVVCFSGVVLLTMIAAEEFDERLVWDKKYADDKELLQNYQRFTAWSESKAHTEHGDDNQQNDKLDANHQCHADALESKVKDDTTGYNSTGSADKVVKDSDECTEKASADKDGKDSDKCTGKDLAEN